ncbi:MAG: L,D-transpeptidase [Clostridia bacterium]|nr:L,D-transpeptidase [Clostridia bacterium]
MKRILIEKEKRLLTVYDGRQALMQCAVALGREPVGHKLREGDGKTPEGSYYICLKRENGKFGPALGISYPSFADAVRAVDDGRLSAGLLPLFEKVERKGERPPWGSPLGGEIYIHGGGTGRDWTAGCVAVSNENMAKLFALCHVGDRVEISR